MHAERRFESAVSAAVVVFVARWLIMTATSKPPEFKPQYGLTAIEMAVLATL